MLRALLWFLRSALAPRRPRNGAETESSDVWSEYATPYRFRFEVLGNAVFEGDQSLRSVLDLTDLVFVNESPEQRRVMAADALEALLDDDLVELEALEGDFDAEALRQSARNILASGGRDAAARVSIRPTSAGTALAEDPPDEIRRLWRLP